MTETDLEANFRVASQLEASRRTSVIDAHSVEKTTGFDFQPSPDKLDAVRHNIRCAFGV
eukprot:IDg15322t1